MSMDMRDWYSMQFRTNMGEEIRIDWDQITTEAFAIAQSEATDEEKEVWWPKMPWDKKDEEPDDNDEEAKPSESEARDIALHGPIPTARSPPRTRSPTREGEEHMSES